MSRYCDPTDAAILLALQNPDTVRAGIVAAAEEKRAERNAKVVKAVLPKVLHWVDTGVDAEGIREPVVDAAGECPGCPHPLIVHDEYGCGVLDCDCPSIEAANERIASAVELDQVRRGGRR